MRMVQSRERSEKQLSTNCNQFITRSSMNRTCTTCQRMPKPISKYSLCPQNSNRCHLLKYIVQSLAPPDTNEYIELFVCLFTSQRHRLVNEVVKQKLQGSFVHALSIEAKSPAQWSENYKLEPSPNCRGGFGK